MDVDKRRRKKQLLKDQQTHELIHNTVLSILLECDITAMPIDLISIAQHYNIRVQQNESLHILSDGEEGISFYRKNRWNIIYDESQRKTRTRFTLAHELGHIMLGHPSYCSRTNMDKATRPAEERDADRFAAELLAPDCVLWGTQSFTSDRIAALCNISKAFSEHKDTTHGYLIGQNKLLKTDLELAVYHNFLPFINEYNHKK